jgi:hypothetical protein
MFNLFKQKKQPPKKQYDLNTKLSFAATNTSYLGTDNKYGNFLKQNGYELDTELDNDREKVFYNKDTKKVIIAYKGTTDYKDVKADLDGIALGDYNHPEFELANKSYENVKNKYGDNILLSGHSLGGSKAINVGKKYNIEDNAVVFNPGTSPLRKLETNAIVYRDPNDLVSNSITGNRINNLETKKTVTYGFGNGFDGSIAGLAQYGNDQLQSHTISGFDSEFDF